MQKGNGRVCVKNITGSAWKGNGSVSLKWVIEGSVPKGSGRVCAGYFRVCVKG